ncbi:MAG: VOC family protein [Comamonadaceae bacterium]|nr:VOC family protein [Comamonadaceae bacterium]
MKLVVDGLSDRVLGVHMIGADAPEIVQSLAVALTCRRDQARLRPHDGRAPDRGRGVRADARAEPGDQSRRPAAAPAETGRDRSVDRSRQPKGRATGSPRPARLNTGSSRADAGVGIASSHHPQTPMRLSAARLFVDDLRAARTFYGAQLALPLRAASPGDAWLVFDAGGLDLVIEPVRADAAAEERALVGRFSGLSFAADDIAATHRRPLAAGVPFCAEPEAQAWGGVLATLLDPAGNSLRLVQHPRERTEGRASAEQPPRRRRAGRQGRAASSCSVELLQLAGRSRRRRAA